MARRREATDTEVSGMEEDAGGEEARGSVPGAQALSKGLTLLNLIADAPQPMRFNDLLRYCGLPKATLHRLLAALIEFRMIRLDDLTQTYRLGHRVFQIAHRVWSEFDLRSAAEPELERLRALASETTRLGILDGDSVLIIDQREQILPMRMGNGVGSNLSPFASALGKALLAHLLPEALNRFLSGRALSALTPNTISNPVEFQRELDLIKARGYAVSIEEHFVGVSGVAAPILNHRGEPLGAISIIGPAFRLPPDRLHALGRDVIEAARRVAGNAGETFMSISSTVSPAHAVDPAVECVVPSSAFLGEGPHWMAGAQSLLWVDILAPALHFSQPGGDTRTLPLGEMVGAVVPRRRGGMVAATQSGFRALDPNSGSMAVLATPHGMAGRRFNDGKCDAAGRFWAGTLALDASPGKGALYRLDPDGGLKEMETGFHICNGLGWSPDSSRFYLADSGARVIYVYDYDLTTGTLTNKRIFARFDAGGGIPDGLAVDADGHVWCALWDGWAVQRWAPDGTLVRNVALPVPRPTSCAFGGPGLKTLFITSARIRLSASQLAAAPLSGSVLAIRTDVSGIPVAEFAG